ncbi:hypothetical protein [Rhodococcus sp. UNC23MFCrub1.1]|uniref:hypothetical protein n=1 Tax=Rhodococcus sp. UNC23MFCrub1.1 TaxID=1449068 RepID=UPI0004881DF9|nr:hypothetical protein [Rhodococcus sp. UNC23MFCrub1.1]
MTVALYVKVFDGIVLATDSATTFSLGNNQYQVYNNADKIFHLHRNLPIAAMTWGLGTVGPASISTISKSFRQKLMGRDASEPGLDVDTYTVEEVAKRVSSMFHTTADEAGLTSWPDELGYLIAGFSSNCAQAEAWLLKFTGAELEPVPIQELSDNDYGFRAYAQPGAVNRLFNGYDEMLEQAILAGNPDPAAAKSVLQSLHLDPVQAGMPLPDAIALAKFMVEVTEGYTRYRFGADTVGGPVEVASLNPHEGFKWIQRKHYFNPALNQGEQTT